jgi:hypothetical protein
VHVVNDAEVIVEDGLSDSAYQDRWVVLLVTMHPEL